MDRTTASALARRISSELTAAGFQAFLVGGCVRDLLLHREPEDYDITTDATPEQVLRLYPKANRVGAHFGVVLVRDGDAQVEVATFRSDHAYADGRHPGQVLFETDPREDVARRDFTINALLMTPGSDHVIDYVGGRDDLRDGIIRAIGDPERRFREDHLRMLRAVRFAARLGFTIEPGTMAAMKALHSLVTSVSAERIRDELTRILTEGGARRGLELLDASGLLADLLPEVKAMQGVDQPPEFHPEGDVWTHTLMMMEGLRSPSPELAWGVLLHDVGKPGTFRIAPDRIRFDGHVELGVAIVKDIAHRLRFSGAQTEQVAALVGHHMQFTDVPRMKDSTLKRFLRMDRFPEHLELHRLDCSSSKGNLETYDLVAEKLRQLQPEHLKPPRLIDGNDLIAAGYQPGPKFSQMLTAVEDAQLDGTIQDREGALRIVRERFG